MAIIHDVYSRWLALLLIIVSEAGLMTSADANPPIMEKSVIHMNITEGKTAILPCLVNTITKETGNKYTVKWVSPRKEMITYGSNMVINDRRFSIVMPTREEWNLRISRVRGRDAGQYLCQLNTVPQQKKSVFLNVHVSPGIVSSKGVNVSEGQDVELQCKVSGRPIPTLTWYRNDQIIPDITDEVLTIQNISRTMAGTFKCFAYNGVKPNVSKTIDVTVHFRPKVMLYTTRIGQYRYKDVILVCLIISNPEGKITWYKNGKNLNNQQWKYELELRNSSTPNVVRLRVKIRSLEREDFGTYTCVAENKVGYDEVSMDVYELTTSIPTTTQPSTIKSTTPGSYKTTHKPVDKEYGTDNGDRNNGFNTNGENSGYADKDGVVMVTDRTSPNGGSTKSTVKHISLFILTVFTSLNL